MSEDNKDISIPQTEEPSVAPAQPASSVSAPVQKPAAESAPTIRFAPPSQPAARQSMQPISSAPAPVAASESPLMVFIDFAVAAVAVAFAVLIFLDK